MEITATLAEDLGLIEKRPTSDQYSYCESEGWNAGIFGPVAKMRMKFDSDRYNTDIEMWRKRNKISVNETVRVNYSESQLRQMLKNKI